MIKIITPNETIPTSSGIYKFTNNINNKIYIGSSINLRKRFLTHLTLLRKNSHHSKSFQNSWNKFGEDVFSYEIMEFVENLDELLIKEQYYLDNILFAQEYINKINNKFIELSYNINPSSTNRLGTVQSEESVTRSKLNNPNRKNILQYDFNGKFIKNWDSASDIQRELNICKTQILKCCKQQSEYASEFIFIFEEDEELFSDYFKSLENFPYVKKVWNKGLSFRPDKDYSLIVFDRYGNYYDMFKYQTDVCKSINCTTTNLSKSKNKKIVKNYYVFDLDFNYKEFINNIVEENSNILNSNSMGDKILMYNIFNKFLLGFNSVKEASELTNLNENSIYNVLCGKRKQIKGFIFKYNEIQNDDIV